MPFSQWWQGFLKSKGVAFAWFVMRRFDEERVPQVAASMTFTTLLALVPVLTVMVVIASAFPFSTNGRGNLSLLSTAPLCRRARIWCSTTSMRSVIRPPSWTAIGSVMLVVTSLMLIRTIDKCVQPDFGASIRNGLG